MVELRFVMHVLLELILKRQQQQQQQQVLQAVYHVLQERIQQLKLLQISHTVFLVKLVTTLHQVLLHVSLVIQVQFQQVQNLHSVFHVLQEHINQILLELLVFLVLLVLFNQIFNKLHSLHVFLVLLVLFQLQVLHSVPLVLQVLLHWLLIQLFAQFVLQERIQIPLSAQSVQLDIIQLVVLHFVILAYQERIQIPLLHLLVNLVHQENIQSHLLQRLLPRA